MSMQVNQQGNNNSSNSSSATKALMSNYSTFLTLLTAQLKHQNPTAPADPNAFTQQLVQYSQVEQQIQTNQKLKSMLDALTSSAALQLVNYVGKTVTVYSDTTKFEGGAAKWTVNASSASKDATITVKDKNGAVVYTGKMDLKAGDNSFSWDGKGKDGHDYSSSTDEFTISVSGTDSNGKAITIKTQVSGKVQSVDTSSSQPYLKVNGKLVPLSDLLTISS